MEPKTFNARGHRLPLAQALMVALQRMTFRGTEAVDMACHSCSTWGDGTDGTDGGKGWIYGEQSCVYIVKFK